MAVVDLCRFDILLVSLDPSQGAEIRPSVRIRAIWGHLRITHMQIQNIICLKTADFLCFLFFYSRIYKKISEV